MDGGYVFLNDLVSIPVRTLDEGYVTGECFNELCWLAELLRATGYHHTLEVGL